jgi:hypothetical protein
MRRLGWILLCIAALAACEGREGGVRRGTETAERAPVEAAFRHHLSGDVSGQYRPVGGGAAPGELAGLFVGQIAAFEAWERGSRAGAPLILTLVGSDGSPPVSLQAYEITDDRLRMTGTAARGEAVRLDLRIDQGALATARRNLGDQTPVMSGAVQVGDRRFPVSLTWWNGD